MFDPIQIGAENWIVPAMGLFLIFAIMLIWLYRHTTTSQQIRWFAFLLKSLAVLLIIIALIEPLWTHHRTKPGENIFLLLGDESASLTVEDPGQSQSRAEQIRELFTNLDADWRVRLQQDFEVREYLFSNSLRTWDRVEPIEFSKTASHLKTALLTLADRFQDQPIAGIMLFSDGLSTQELLNDHSIPWKSLPPVFPVALQTDNSYRDLAVRSISVTETSFEDAPVTIQAQISAIGIQENNVHIELLDEQGTVIATDHWNLTEVFKDRSSETSGSDQPEQSSSLSASHLSRFQFRPKGRTLQFYRVEATLLPVEKKSSSSAKLEFSEKEQSAGNRESSSDSKSLRNKPSPSPIEKASHSAEELQEATLENNVRWVKVDRSSDPLRILYIAGRPNWDYKFLRRAVSQDESIDLVGMIRIAEKEPKFDFRGRDDESSNPLFRGFKKQSDAETERFDEAVIMRLDTKEQSELRGGFPKTLTELYRYQGIILDDLDAEFFQQEQMEMISKFVSERGGGFMMLGGQESFSQGDFHRTPIADLLPVFLESSPTQQSQTPFRWELTKTGKLEPWMRLRLTEEEEEERLASMPLFRTTNQVVDIKPGANVLARIRDAEGTTRPALIAQRFGRGISIAVLMGDLWRWPMERKLIDEHRDDYAQAWRQLLRQMVSDVPIPISLVVEHQPQKGDGMVLLQAKVLDESYQPRNNAAVTFQIKPPESLSPEVPSSLELDHPSESSTNTELPTNSKQKNHLISLQANPSLQEPGLYEISFPARDAGRYHWTALVTNERGETVGEETSGWVMEPSVKEFQQLSPNVELLKQLAERTGGEVLAQDQLMPFATGLPEKSVPVKEIITDPLWHQPWYFLAILGCLLGEWGLRRWRGLA